MKTETLENIIRQYVQLGPVSNTGWTPCLCKVCNDKGHKGMRAAFKFDDDAVAYHCFNCGHTAVFNPNDTDPDKPLMSKSMIQVMDDFAIPEDEWKQVQLAVLANRDAKGLKSRETQEKIVNIEPPEISLPPTFYPLADAEEGDKWAAIARFYLEDRGVDPDSYPFMLSSFTKDVRLEKWMGRVIIPIFKDDKVIFYIGRDLTGTKQKKYESPSESRDKVLYGFDKLFKDYEQPLYVVEGWFDAEAIDGVALLGNEISDNQIKWLNRSRRKKVYIPDRFGDGKLGAKRALQAGWHVSTPDMTTDIKDMSDAVLRYGKMYVMKTLADNTATGLQAEMNINIWCK